MYFNKSAPQKAREKGSRYGDVLLFSMYMYTYLAALISTASILLLKWVECGFQPMQQYSCWVQTWTSNRHWPWCSKLIMLFAFLMIQPVCVPVLSYSAVFHDMHTNIWASGVCSRSPSAPWEKKGSSSQFDWGCVQVCLCEICACMGVCVYLCVCRDVCCLSEPILYTSFNFCKSILTQFPSYS